MKIIKKYITILIFSLATINFSAPVDDATKILDIQQRQLEQERSRMEQQKSQEEFENTRFNDVPMNNDVVVFKPTVPIDNFLSDKTDFSK